MLRGNRSVKPAQEACSCGMPEFAVDVTMLLGCYMATRPRRAPCPRLQLVVLAAGG